LSLAAESPENSRQPWVLSLQGAPLTIDD